MALGAVTHPSHIVGRAKCHRAEFGIHERDALEAWIKLCDAEVLSGSLTRLLQGASPPDGNLDVAGLDQPPAQRRRRRRPATPGRCDINHISVQVASERCGQALHHSSSRARPFCWQQAEDVVTMALEDGECTGSRLCCRHIEAEGAEAAGR